MASRALIYPIIFDPSGARKGARQAEQELDRLNRVGVKALGGLKTAGIAAGIGFAAIGVAAFKFGKDSVKASIEAEKAMAKVKAMVEATGVSWKKHGDEIERVIDLQSKKSGFDDEELAQSFGNLTRITGDYNKALQLNATVMDLARGRGISLAQASTIIGRVASGAQVSLARYGITLDKNATAQERLAAIQRQFAGQTEAYGRTTQGSIDKASVAWENLQETIGNKLAPVVARFFNWVTSTAIPTLERWWPSIERVATTIGNALGKAFSAIADAAERYWPVVRRAAEQAVTWVRENVVPIIRGVVTIAVALWNRFGQTFMNVVREAVQFIGRTLQRVVSAIRGIVEIIQGIANGDWSKAWDGLKRVASAVFGQLVDLIKTVPATLLNAAKDIGIKLARAVAEGFRSIIGSIWDLIHSQGDARVVMRGGALTILTTANRASGGFVDGPGPRGVDSVPAMLAPGEVVLNDRQQRMLGPARIMDVLARTGGVIGGRRFASGGVATASWFNDTSTASGRNASTAMGWAELSNPPASLNYSALGGLPMGTRITVTYKGRSVTIPKIDKGAGGAGLNGHVRAIDLSVPAKNALGFPDLADVTWSKAGAAGSRTAAIESSAARVWADSQVGRDYSWGGGRDSSRGFDQVNWDCSSFAIAVARKAGAHVELYGTTADAWRQSTPLSGAQAASAPVVWGFWSSSGGPIDGGSDEHMGVRVNGVWYDASGSADQVRRGYYNDSMWNKGIRLPRGLSATASTTRAVASSPGTPARPVGPSAGDVSAARASDTRATTGVPANANTSTTYAWEAGGGGRTATSNIRFDTRDEPSAGGIARPGSGAPASRVPAGWTEIPHRIYVGQSKPNMATLRSRVPGDWRIEINRAGDGRWVATALEPVPPQQPGDGGGGGDAGAAAPAAAPSLGDLLPALQADARKNLALAALTPGLEDDIAAAQANAAIAGQMLAMASDIGDPGLIADAATNLKSAQDFLAGLQQQQQDALKANTDAVNANTEALNNFTGAVGFGFRGQSYYVGQGRTQSSDSLLDLGVGV